MAKTLSPDDLEELSDVLLRVVSDLDHTRDVDPSDMVYTCDYVLTRVDALRGRGVEVPTVLAPYLEKCEAIRVGYFRGDFDGRPYKELADELVRDARRVARGLTVQEPQIITVKVASALYNVSEDTIARRFELPDGDPAKLTDHRPPGHGRTATIWVDELEIARQFEKR